MSSSITKYEYNVSVEVEVYYKYNILKKSRDYLCVHNRRVIRILSSDNNYSLVILRWSYRRLSARAQHCSYI